MANPNPRRADGPAEANKRAVDKDLKRIVQLEKATIRTSRANVNVGFAVLFLVAIWIYVYFQLGSTSGAAILIVSAVVGGYMAMTIGANDVANNVGPAVGSKALTMFGALVIAAIFEAAGAVVAGGDVVATISKSIVSADSVSDPSTFIWVMLSALLAAALWVHLATALGAPISTTHSIVGAVLGSGMVAAGADAVNWPTMGEIAASWVISPILGGVVAAVFLAFIKFAVLYQPDRVAAARQWVPVLVAIMASAFTVYLVTKGLQHVWTPSTTTASAIGFAAFAIAYVVVRRLVARASIGMPNKRKSVSNLFTIPLICAAALLSFAHGSNDVANAVGPLAAIVNVVEGGGVTKQVSLPFWVLAMGGLGISIGLMLFGPKIVRIVGEKITRLDRTRAFCVALSAAITVIIASGLGLPVSSTHIAVGAVFGVGFLREFVIGRGRHIPVRARSLGAAATELQDPLQPQSVPAADGVRLGDMGPLEAGTLVQAAKKAGKRKLVRRRHLVSIVAAWLVTVPASALLAAALYAGLAGLR